MKHARPDYDRIQDPAGLIPADEPVFLLRAKDRVAPWTVEAWADRVKREGVATVVFESASHQAKAMREWLDKYGCQVPDAPQGKNSTMTKEESNFELPKPLLYICTMIIAFGLVAIGYIMGVVTS